MKELNPIFFTGFGFSLGFGINTHPGFAVLSFVMLIVAIVNLAISEGKL